MLIFGPLAGPTTSAVTVYPLSSAGSLITVLPSATSSAGNETLDPASSSASLSTVSTSSRATFSCLPPQRTIAYTRELPLPESVPQPFHGDIGHRAYSGLARVPDMPSYVHDRDPRPHLPL